MEAASVTNRKLYCQEWHDDYLTWNPDNYDGVDELVLSPTHVWLPDIGIVNRSVDFSVHGRTEFQRY